MIEKRDRRDREPDGSADRAGPLRSRNGPADLELLRDVTDGRRVHPFRAHLSSPVAEERGDRRELRDPREGEKPVLLHRRIVRDVNAPPPEADARLDRLPARRPPVLTVRRVEPREGIRGNDRPAEDPHPDAEVVRRDEVAPHFANRFARSSLREALERAVEGREWHRPRLVVEIVPLDMDRLEPLLRDPGPLVRVEVAEERLHDERARLPSRVAATAERGLEGGAHGEGARGAPG